MGSLSDRERCKREEIMLGEAADMLLVTCSISLCVDAGEKERGSVFVFSWIIETHLP